LNRGSVPAAIPVRNVLLDVFIIVILSAFMRMA
jgi:hypothetical protein